MRSLAGDKEGARQAYLEGKTRLELRQQQEPGNYSIASSLGFCEAGLGNKEAALREGERAMSLLPASEDAVFGPIAEENLAGVEAQVGEAGARHRSHRTAPDHALRRVPPYPSPPAARSRLGPTAPASAFQGDRRRAGAEDHLSIDRHEECFRRAEAAQCLSGRGRVCRGRVAADSDLDGDVSGSSRFRTGRSGSWSRLLALGFPIALMLAWAFELTPEGIQTTKSTGAEQVPPKRTRRGLFWSLDRDRARSRRCS